ncbi:MAG: ketopantoate reductase family protein [Microbacteriaceae bacterium]
MRIAVVGAGAIGGTIAAVLDRAGHDVAVTARGAHLTAIQNHGLKFSGAWGEHVAQVTASETLASTPELAFVCTKAQDARAALTANLDRLTAVPVAIVQNGLAGLRQAEEILPQSACIGGLALYAANFQAPGQITVTSPGETYFGAGTGHPPATARMVADLLGEAIPASAVPNFTGCQWTKLIVNQINAMPAITGMSVQDTIADPRLRHLITAGMREAVRTGHRVGIRYGRIQGLSDLGLRMFAAAPVWLGQQLPLLMRRKMGSTPNLGSTLQSIRRGQQSEIDYLNGAVVTAAAEVGIPVPINAAMVALVHEVEEAGAFLSAEQVLERVASA